MQKTGMKQQKTGSKKTLFYAEDRKTERKQLSYLLYSETKKENNRGTAPFFSTVKLKTAFP